MDDGWPLMSVPALAEALPDRRCRVVDCRFDLMDPNDPPFYAQNDLEPAGPNAPPLSVNLAFHHANHALVLQEKADEIGLENVVYMKGLMVEDPSGEDDVDFGLRHFGL